MKKLLSCFIVLIWSMSIVAQIGTRFPSERKVIKDPKTGVELVFLTSKSGTGDSKIYQTHNQWTADGKWVVFRSDRVKGEALAVNEETGDIVQVTEGGFTGMLCVARKSMNLYHMRIAKDKNGERMGMEVVEVNLEKLFADSEAGKLKGKKNYERICGVIPTEMCSEGDMALDGSETFAYFRLDKEYARRMPIAEPIAGNFGPRNMGAGPGGIGKIDLMMGVVQPVVAVHFKVGHIQGNPWHPGEVIFCWETGGKAPQRTWMVNADGTNLRPIYRETEYDWVTHEAVISEDELVIALIGHRPIAHGERNMDTTKDWGPSGTKEYPTGIAVVNMRTREITLEGQVDGDNFWHVAGSHDGHWVAGDDFARELWLIDRHTKERILLTAGHKTTAHDHVHPTFKPDGTAIEIQSAMLSEDGRSMNICVVKLPQYLIDRYRKSDNTINVKDFGAKGDGRHIDSPAINAALEQAANYGGGTVVLPEGTYLAYSIHLQSGVTLRLEKGAVLKAAPTTSTEGYDEAEPNDSHYQDFGHSHWHNSLIWGENLHDVTLEGEGLIDGSDVLTRGRQQKDSTGQTTANKAMAMRNCHNVTIRGLKFLSCGHFALLLTGVDDLLIENVTADTNRDGFDIDCCERVTIRGCKVNTVNDDAIVLKCSYALGREKPTADVLIEDCHVSGYDVGSMLDGTRTTKTEKAPDGDGPTGRIKLGTESNGGFQRITIRRCTFTHCRGLALETVDGAPMEDIDVSDLTMTDICNSPIYIRLGNRMRAPEGFHTSSTDNIRLRRINVTDADSRYACLIAGIEGNPVRNVCIEDLNVQFRGGLTFADVHEQRGANPFFFGGKNGQPRINRHESHSGYPEPSAHGIQPAWGFSISHAEDIMLNRITLSCMQPDERPWLHQKDTKRVRLGKIKIL